MYNMNFGGQFVAWQLDLVVHMPQKYFLTFLFLRTEVMSQEVRWAILSQIINVAWKKIVCLIVA